MAQTRITIYLLENIETPDDALDTEGADRQPVVIELKSGVAEAGRFYSSNHHPRPPAWVKAVEPMIVGGLATAKTASVSGLLVIKVSTAWFAITFGYGRALLDFDRVVRRFGLRATLNRVDPQKLRSVDTKMLEDMVVSRRTQASRSATADSFGIDVVQDVLRGATGEARDERLGKRLTGADALVVSVDLDEVSLPDLCSEAHAAFREDGYQQHFPWVDNLESLASSDPRVARLEAEVIANLRVGETSRMHLAVPDVVEWREIDAFKIAGTRDAEYLDLDLDEYLTALPDRQKLDAQLLRRRKVFVRFTSGAAWNAQWSLFQCLVCEVTLDEELFVLTEGQWFKVARSLLDRVNAYLGGISQVEIVPVRGVEGEAEATFNERFQAALSSSAVLLDKTQVRVEGAASGIEPCDVLLESGEFVHVKRKSRSSTLSHLFSQGSVSLTAFLTDPSFRDQLRDLIHDKVDSGQWSGWDLRFPDGSTLPNRTSFTVVFVVVAASKPKDGLAWLPFFSRLNLMQHATSIRSTGAEVSVQLVGTS